MLSAEQQADAEKRMKELAAEQDAEKTIKTKISSQAYMQKMFPRPSTIN